MDKGGQGWTCASYLSQAAAGSQTRAVPPGESKGSPPPEYRTETCGALHRWTLASGLFRTLHLAADLAAEESACRSPGRRRCATMRMIGNASMSSITEKSTVSLHHTRNMTCGASHSLIPFKGVASYDFQVLDPFWTWILSRSL